MEVVRREVTAEELLRMPDDGFRHELVRGELRRMTPVGNVDGRVAMNIAWPLAQYVNAHDLGTVYAAETGFRLTTDPDTVRARQTWRSSVAGASRQSARLKGTGPERRIWLSR